MIKPGEPSRGYMDLNHAVFVRETDEGRDILFRDGLIAHTAFKMNEFFDSKNFTRDIIW